MGAAEIRKEFGAAVRAQRVRLGYSQEALAARAKLHRTYVTDVERGARNVSLESISRLARALEVSTSSLFKAPKGTAVQDLGSANSISILLVEDDPKDLELAMKAFAQAGLTNRLEAVRDGPAALDYLFCRGRFSKRQPRNLPQVVLLDLYLPKMNGLEVLRALRADARTRSLHVVVLTGSHRDTHFREALYLGATGYIIKPVDFQRFSAVTPQLNFSWALLRQASEPRNVSQPSTSA